MVDGNIGEIGRMLNMVHFYDIGVLEDYLVGYFGDRIRSCKDVLEMEELFGGKDYKYFFM